MKKFIKSFFDRWFLRKHSSPQAAKLLMDAHVVRIVYTGPDETELFRMVFKNQVRCRDMLDFIFQEVDFGREYGQYSLKYYGLSGDEAVLEKIYYTDLDSPRTWYYLANFIGF